MAISMKISVSSIKNDASKIENDLSSIPALIDELEKSMGQLAQCWEGQAWDVYQTNIALDIEILTEIYRYMGGFTKSINEAATIYQRVEQDVCSTIDRIVVF